MEIWQPIEGYHKTYFVSSQGRVARRLGKVLHMKAQVPDSDGYMLVQLWQDGKPATCKVHRLVAQTFIPNPDQKPQVNHLNSDKTCNTVHNLEWCTASENMTWAWEHGERCRPAG